MGTIPRLHHENTRFVVSSIDEDKPLGLVLIASLLQSDDANPMMEDEPTQLVLVLSLLEIAATTRMTLRPRSDLLVVLVFLRRCHIFIELRLAPALTVIPFHRHIL